MKELEDSKAGKTGDELKAIEDKIKAKNSEIAKEAMKKDTVTNAQKAMRDEKSKNR